METEGGEVGGKMVSSNFSTAALIFNYVQKDV